MKRQCTHQTQRDHTLRKRVNGRLVWKCSVCEKTGHWTDTWTYYGNIECKRCGWTQIDWVACSDRCKNRFKEFQLDNPPPAGEKENE